MIELALRYARISCCLVLLMGSGHLTGNAQQHSAVPPHVLIAPESYRSLIPRLSAQPSVLYHNLLYEGNNSIMRGSSTGVSIAEHWRSIVVHTQGTFLLRDALFSQQDHPYRVSPFALMLPANWVTAAASESGNIQPLVAPDFHNDSAWLAITTPGQMFGSFPPSEVLFKLATSATDSAIAYHAREAIVILARYAQRLIDWRKNGIEAMIQEGADIIAQSDTLYFGSDVRRHHVIPIMVENPTRHEIEEGKGVIIPGRSDVSDETAAAVRRVTYRRRLQDGDIAIERYDISNPAECVRAIRVLEDLIPKGSSGATVWLWVTGKLRSDRKLEGEDALAYIDGFRQKVAAANIEESRLDYVSKPSVRLSGRKRMKQSLDEAVNRFRQLRLPVSINLTGEQLKQLLGSE